MGPYNVSMYNQGISTNSIVQFLTLFFSESMNLSLNSTKVDVVFLEEFVKARESKKGFSETVKTNDWLIVDRINPADWI